MVKISDYKKIEQYVTQTDVYPLEISAKHRIYVIILQQFIIYYYNIM